MKFTDRIFGKRPTEQEKKITAEMEYREQERAFRRYDSDLDKSIVKFENMAMEAMKAGQKGNALCAARFVAKMKLIKDKVASVRQHFEMLHALSTVSDIMVQFMDQCTALGCDLKEKIDIKSLSNSQIGMETGLNKLAFVTECVEQAFEQIENSLDIGALSDPESDEESEAMLNEILMKYGKAADFANDSEKEREESSAESTVADVSTCAEYDERSRRLEAI